MGDSSPEGWLQDTLCREQDPTANENTYRVPSISREPREVCGAREGGGRYASEGGNRESLPRGPGLLQSPVSGPQSLRRMAPNIRRLQIKQVCKDHKIFYGDCTDGARNGAGRGLDDLAGHEGRIFPHPYTPPVQEISKVRFQQGSVPVQGLVFRAEHSPTSVYESDSTISQDNASSGVQNCPISGRLASASKIKRRDTEGEEFYIKSDKGIGNINKRRKVSFGTITILGVPGDGDRYNTFLGFPIPETYRKGLDSIRKIVILKSYACKILAEHAGLYGFPGEVCDRCQAPHAKVPILLKESMEERMAGAGRIDTDAIGSEKELGMVEEQRQATRGHIFGTEGAGSTSIHGRKQRVLGSDNEPSSSLREMEPGGKEVPYQQAGTASNFLCPERSRRDGIWKESGNLLGQYHGTSVYKEARRYEIVGSFPPSGGSVPLATAEKSNFSPEIRSGEKQRSGRHPEQERSNYPHRMVSEWGSMFATVETLGSTPDRHVCDLTNEEAPNLLLPSSGQRDVGE